jgi:hypothetical protein
MRKLQIPDPALKALLNDRKYCSSRLSDDGSISIPDNVLEWFETTFKLKDKHSSFVAYYSAVISPPVGCDGLFLFTLDDILENSSLEFYTDFFLNPSVVKGDFGKRYFVLTSGEGGYFFFYDSETDGVYDSYDVAHVAIGEKLPDPKWKTFYDFLESYYGEGVYE